MNTLRVREVSGRYHVRWWCAQRADWEQILASFRSTFRTHGTAVYSRRTGWSLPLAQGVRLAEWANAHFACDEVQWEHRWDEPSGYTYRDRTCASSVPESLAAAYRTLHLVPSAPLWAAEAVYRAAMKRAHPDAGGDHGSAVRLARAMETIRRHTHKRSA